MDFEGNGCVMDSIYSGVSGGVTMRKTSVRDEDEISEERGE